MEPPAGSLHRTRSKPRPGPAASRRLTDVSRPRAGQDGRAETADPAASTSGPSPEARMAAGPAAADVRLTSPTGWDRTTRMINQIDLRPILVDPAAAEILLLARGQLNRAFRRHGLVPPDPLVLSGFASGDPMELDDPAAQGIEHAMARFQEDFTTWATAMPVKLVPPVMDILRNAHQTLIDQQNDSSPAGVALEKACAFLSGCLLSGPDR